MKEIKYALILVFLVTMSTMSSIQAQDMYMDKKSKVTFEVSKETYEPVKAINKCATVILNAETGEIASLALVRGFKFENSLMEEHFNENYMESDIYPKIIFKGYLLNFDMSTLTQENTDIIIEGLIELHGKEKQIKAILKARKSNGSIIIEGSFKVTPTDFDIKIPNILKHKIAEQITIYLDFKFDKKILDTIVKVRK